MSSRLPHLPAELLERALSYVDRRGGAGLRRGGRGRGGAGKPVARFDATKLYALSSFSAANFYQTLVGGGELGVASGFGSVVVIQQTQRPATTTPSMTGSNANNGHGFYFDSSGIRFRATSSTPAILYTPAKALNASDLGQLRTLIGGYYPGGILRMHDARDQYGADTAITGYTPATAAAVIGNLAGNAYLQGCVVGTLHYRGAPTDAHLKALSDAIRVLGDVPSKAAAEALMPGTTVTRRISLRDVLAAANVPVTTGTVAPATIPDSVTAATVDAMARTGSPTITVIDPSIDGRKSYGVLGLSAANHLKTAVGAGIRALPTAFTVRLVVIFRSIAAGVEYIANASNASASTGWAFYRSGATLVASAGNGTARESSRTLTAADLGIPHTVDLFYDGAAVSIVFDGVAGTPVAGAVADFAAAPMTIGALSTGLTYPATNEEVYAIAGDVGLTLAQVQEAAATYRRTGTFQSFGAATVHSYDLTADIIANSGPTAGIPATVLDRVGTDHLTRVGGLQTVSNGAATGLRGFLSGSNYLTTPTTGGLAGTAAGFWASVLYAPQTFTGLRVLFGKSNHGAAGWAIVQNASYVVIYLSDGAGVQQQGPQLSLGAGYLGTLIHLSFTFSGGQITGYLNGTQYASPVAITGFSPGVTGLTIGVTNTGTVYGAKDCDIFGAAGGHFVPTAGEIATASADSVSSGSIAAVPAKTSHRYDLKADIATAGGVPLRAVERTSGVDTMVVVNNKLEVAQRAERMWSYESTPILYGASGFTQANYYATGVWNEPAASPWWTAGLFTVLSQSVASGNRSILGNGELTGGSTYSGFHLCTSGTNTLCYINLSSAAGAFVTGPVGSIAAADVGKLLLYVGVWDPVASKIRGYFKRAEIGTGSALAAYLPAAATPMRMGRSISNADWSANNIVSHGVSGGFGLPTLAQVQALFDETQAVERIGSIAGMTNFRIDLTQDASGNGGVLPATLTDRSGGNFNFTRTGSITTAAQYARAWNW